jgi:two-component system response regulator MprA
MNNLPQSMSQSRPRILIVDDAPDVQLLAKKALESSFEVAQAMTLSAARAALDRSAVDLVVLDISMPDGNGIDFCRSMGEHPSQRNIPVIFLSVHGEVTDKLAGFSAGAQDYMVKPFHPAELQVRAQMRLKSAAPRPEAARPAGEAITIGDLRFDLKTHGVSVVNGNRSTELPLTQQEFKLLICLARAGGKILSREDIVKQVWDHDLRVTERTVDTHVCKLRKKITDSASRFTVQAVYGAGYRFVEPGHYL